MRDHRRESRAPGERARVDGLGERSDLVHLDENGVRRFLFDPALQARDARHEKIVPDELHSVAQRGGQLLPPVPVVLSQAVLDRNDRIPVRPLGVERDHAARVERTLLARERVVAIAIELGRSGIERDRRIHTRAISRALDGSEHELERLLVRF